VGLDLCHGYIFMAQKRLSSYGRKYTTCFRLKYTT
jgi:hypothetical protein